jgi:uncharacterized C2H2 Zn-finger protein
MITCEHCGTAINLEKDKRCPNCGASFSRNKEYKELKDNQNKEKEYDFREREADIKTKEITNDILEKQNNMVANHFDFTKKTFSVLLIIFAIIFVASLIFIIFVSKNMFDFIK